MLTFVTLFLGLVVGERPIELAVGSDVTAVELRLDGEQIALLTGEPWSVTHDFGRALQPHRLSAIARGANGEPLARIEQWINMPRSTAEAGMLMEPDPASGRQRVRLTWESVAGDDPQEVVVALDGQPVAADDPRTILLPPYDPEEVHFLRAELRFPSGLTSAVEATFGGTYGDSVQTQLTAVPLAYEGRRPPTMAELAGALRAGGEPAVVTAVEQGVGETIFLIDLGALRGLQALLNQSRRLTNWRWRAPLRQDQRLRVIRTFPASATGGGADGERGFDLFPSSATVTSKQGGLLFLLAGLAYRADAPVTQRLADVVAAAGVSAAGNRNRRHVVLILGEERPDGSAISPDAARLYLEALQVPLSVWSVARTTGETTTWGEVVDISTLPAFERAARALVRSLDRQVIAWIGGRHLPQTIELASENPSFSIAR